MGEDTRDKEFSETRGPRFNETWLDRTRPNQEDIEEQIEDTMTSWEMCADQRPESQTSGGTQFKKE